MDIRKIRENMGRVKVYYLKGKTQLALGFAVKGLKELGSATPPTEVKSAIREAIQYLSGDESLANLIKIPLTYQPGQENQLLAILSKAYIQMEVAAKTEEHAQALVRKQKIDQNLVLGKKLLEQGKVSDADACFNEAVNNYRNEHRLFQMIGKSLLEANQPQRAYPYLKRAVELEPENRNALNMLDQAASAREGNA